MDQLKDAVLGPREYEVRLAREWRQDGFVPPEGVSLLERVSDRIRFRVDDPLVANPQLVRELAARQAPIVSVSESPRTLEQVYLKVMADAQAGRSK
jgi:ABC-2 type transport system ATP-binding protein